jgi:hypothetical protein
MGCSVTDLTSLLKVAVLRRCNASRSAAKMSQVPTLPSILTIDPSTAVDIPKLITMLGELQNYDVSTFNPTAESD